MPRTILVTGAGGFIGSHVAQRFLQRGDTVVGLDNLNSYYNPERKRSNLRDVERCAAAGAKFRFIEGDIRDRQLLDRVFAESAPNAVAHLAAMAGVRVSIDNPYLYYDVNLIGTLALLDAARQHQMPNFVCASTSSVYGRTEQMPFAETDPCDRPLAPYAASKRAAEQLGFTYHHLYGQNFTALRFFTVYGPRGRPDMMAYMVVESILSGIEVPLYEGGRMHRDWTYIDDIVSGVVAAIDRPLGYEIINLGRGAPVLLADFVHLIEDLVGRKAHLVPTPMPETDIPYTYADIGKARTLLNYHPQISVQEGVTRFWDWYHQTFLGRDVGHAAKAGSG